jgi:hypothetical protein
MTLNVTENIDGRQFFRHRLEENKKLYHNFQFLSFLSNKSNTFLRSHSFWKVQSLILVFCIDIDMYVAFPHRYRTLLGRRLGLMPDTA